MSKSRREFLVGLAASGAIVTLSSKAFARAGILCPALNSALLADPPNSSGVDFKIGYSAIAWHDQDTQAINDLSTLGIPGIQLRANVVTEVPDPHALRDMLAQRHLTFVALSSGTAPLDPELRQTTIDTHMKNAKYLHEAGGNYLQIVPAGSKGGSFSAGDAKYEGRFLTEIGKRVADLGHQMSVHNHMGTISQTPEGLEAILNEADPQYVKLELDTAHYLQGGGDPAAAVRKYSKRLLFLHLKDVKDAPTKGGYEFVELGQGRLDFPAVFEALKSVNFHGWGIVELDGEHVGAVSTPIESAKISKSYLEQKLGIRV
ncbi:sugar phosphate isomerase/epimerase family protein [Tunturiibacter lichenicola]|uniref:sugar phosphate isomerase/epimerase family protein n=1 Tax=Tunturiibacter lichenicola TaxID=2051959 RepID=UPI003D9B493B